jgi:gluconolactonase
MRQGPAPLLLLILSTAVACGDSDSPSNEAAGSGASGAGANGSGASASNGSGASGAGGGSGGSAAFQCPPGPFGEPLPEDTNATPVQGGFHFLEGPVWFGDLGVLFFSDMDFAGAGPEGWPPATIHQLTPPSTITPFLEIGCNGLAINPQGGLVACTHDERSLSLIDVGSMARTPIVGTYLEEQFSSPNDAVVRSDGTIYFTDPTWQLGDRPQEIDFKGVYRVLPPGDAELVADDFGSPNGVALSPDETRLFVADDSNGQVREFSVAGSGATREVGLFTTVAGADGMGMDCAGNLYVTANGGVTVVAPDGGTIGSITVAEKPANVTFGGADRQTLYITAGPTLYMIGLMVPGLP